MYQFGIIFGTLVLAPFMGVYGLAWGVVLGAALYLSLQIPTLLKQKGAYTPGFGWGNPAVVKVITLMGPRLLGVAVVQLNFWVNAALASQMSAGSMTDLSYGFSVMLMAQAVIAQSVAIAAMPTFSAQHALGQVDQMRASLAASLRGVILFAVPASVGLILLRLPLVSALFERGKFDATDTQMAAWALLWYAAGMVGHSLMEVLTRAFYAQHDTKTPVLIGTVAMGLNVVFSFSFSTWFASLGWLPLGGLALANSLATALEAAVLFIFIRRRLHGIEGKSVADGAARVSLAALGMALGLMAWLQFAGGLNRWLVTLGGVALGVCLYGAGLVALRVPEIKLLTSAVSNRFKR